GCGTARASATRRGGCSKKSTASSARASTRPTWPTPAPCSTAGRTSSRRTPAPALSPARVSPGEGGQESGTLVAPPHAPRAAGGGVKMSQHRGWQLLVLAVAGLSGAVGLPCAAGEKPGEGVLVLRLTAAG